MPLAAAQQPRCHRCALALQILVRCDVVNLFEQAQEVMPRQKRRPCHVAKHEWPGVVAMDEIGCKRNPPENLPPRCSASDRNLPGPYHQMSMIEQQSFQQKSQLLLVPQRVFQAHLTM